MKRKGFFISLISIIEIALVVFGLLFMFREDPNKPAGVTLLIVAGVLLLFVVINYNKIVRYKNKIKESFALVDIQLKSRFDLIPNLVKIVKKHGEHEKEVLTEVTKLRKLATSATETKEKLEYANKIVPQMKNLIAIAESYPDIKSSVLYKSLMEELVSVEDRLVAARRIYDSNVNIYNTTIQVFPNNLLAFMFDFEKEEMFKIDAGENIKPIVNLE